MLLDVYINVPVNANLNMYHKWLSPEFDSGGEDEDTLNDFYFDYGDFRFIGANSGPSKYYYTEILDQKIVIDPKKTMDKNQAVGYDDDQFDWIKNKADGHRTFIFQHTPIVGHGGNMCIDNHREDFVEWANQGGVNVEAVFVGHTHQDHIFYDVHTDLETDGHYNDAFEKSSPASFYSFDFLDNTYYIENTEST